MDKFGAPQIIVLALLAMHFIVFLVHHGKPRTNYNAGDGAMTVAVWLVLLHSGGFFSTGAP